MVAKGFEFFRICVTLWLRAWERKVSTWHRTQRDSVRSWNIAQEIPYCPKMLLGWRLPAKLPMGQRDVVDF